MLNRNNRPAPQHMMFYVVCGVALLTGLLMFLDVPYAWVIGLALGLLALLAGVGVAGVTHAVTSASATKFETVQLKLKGLLTVIPEAERGKWLERPARCIIVRRNTLVDEEDMGDPSQGKHGAWSVDNEVYTRLLTEGRITPLSLPANLSVDRLRNGSIAAPLPEPVRELAEPQYVLSYAWPGWTAAERIQNTATENVTVRIALRFRPRIPSGEKRPQISDIMLICTADVSDWSQLVQEEAFHAVQEAIRGMDPERVISDARTWGLRAVHELDHSLREYGLEATLRIETVSGVASRDKAETEAMERAKAAGWADVAEKFGKGLSGAFGKK